MAERAAHDGLMSVQIWLDSINFFVFSIFFLIIKSAHIGFFGKVLNFFNKNIYFYFNRWNKF